MAAYEYVFTPGVGDTVTLNTNTQADEVGSGARLAFFEYCQVDGRDAIRLGKTGRVLNFRGWLHATSEANLRTSMEALSTAASAAEVGTLAIRGASVTWSNVVITAPPVFGEHYVDLSTSNVGVSVVLRFEQLVP